MIANETLMAREKKQKRRLGVAVGWVADQNQPYDMKQIEEASQRFNLSPLDKVISEEDFTHSG